jgi:tRNA (cmo5U34)-methyltransferase
MQFIPPEQKNDLTKKIYSALIKGGALILSEKIKFKEKAMQQHIESLYFDFKRFNGYNELEISQKRDALENVLHLNTETEHLKRLADAGFSFTAKWFSHLNFASFLAVK